jgi:AraC-like DNA-binding protein
MFSVTSIYFSVFILSLVVFGDVLIKFKRPLILKFHFLLLIFSIALISLIFSLNLTRFAFLVPFLKSLTMVAFLNIYFHLFFSKLKPWIYFLSFLIVGSSIFITIDSFKIIPELNLLDSIPQTIGLKYKVDSITYVALKIYRLIILFIFIATLFYFWFSIKGKKFLDNFYFDKIKNWSSFIFSMIILLVINNIIVSFLNPNVLLMHFLFNLHYLYLLILILYRPVFLNRSAMKISFGAKFNLDTKYPISEKDFIFEFYTKMYFTKPEASLEHFAGLLSINVNELYLFIYNKYSISFLDLVNKNRVAYFLDIVQEDKFQNYTIEALAKLVGFSSRQHLYKPFKKFHGGNPSDIIEASSK